MIRGLGTVCAAHTHHKVTPGTGSTSDRGTTSVVASGQADSSGQTDSSQTASMAKTGRTESSGQTDSSGQADDDGRRAGNTQSTELGSPSAMVQWAELPSVLSLSIALSPVACTVADSRTWSDVTGSGSGAILSSAAPLGDGSSVVVGSGSCSTQRGDGGLGSGS